MDMVYRTRHFEKLSSLQRLKFLTIIEKGPQSVYPCISFFLLCLYSECPVSEVILHIL